LIADDVRQLIGVFNQSDLTELSIEQNGRKLFLRKESYADGAQLEEPPEVATPSTAAVSAHMVGVFHWTKDKRGKAGVALDQRVEKGQVVGFIEAMGIMNELESGASGRVIEIAAANGQPVEYGQPIVILQTD